MPEEYMGDVIGDINSRRGRIEGMDDIGGGKMIRGYVPLSETIQGFKEILEGKHDDIPENLFLNAGNIDDVLARVK